MAPRSLPSEKTLILVRHGHRNKDRGRAFDNGLSKKGRQHARAVAKFYQERFGEEPCLLLSSPKLRCMETLEPLAENLSLAVEESELLLEGENHKQVLQRVGEFKKWWLESAPARVVACSHGDWIPAALKAFCSVETELKKGGWAELAADDGEVELQWLVQKLTYNLG